MEQRNLLIAVVLSLGILLSFQSFYDYHYPAPADVLPHQETAVAVPGTPATGSANAVPAPGVGTGAVSAPASVASGLEVGGPLAGGLDRGTALATDARIVIDSSRVRGSVRLKGGRLDDIALKAYRETTDPSSAEIVLFQPSGTALPYYAEFGWVVGAGDVAMAVPNADTLWQADAATLTPEKPLVLRWKNGQGLEFTRQIALDDTYLFTVTDSVRNVAAAPLTLYPYGLVSRTGTPETQGFFILHEGLLGVFDQTLEEVDYDDLQETPDMVRNSQGGWIGITDKYWLAALIPDQGVENHYRFTHRLATGRDKYQVDFRGAALALPAGGVIESVTRLFIGAKEVRLLDGYGENLNIPLFDRAVDFGWFYFLTKPIFYLLDYMNQLIGNFGLAILALTVLIKLVFFPLANKSYRSMSKMKLLQPKVVELRARLKDDRPRMNQEMMELYKREKINPLAGCLPVLIQLPVFFSLYKVLFVTIEMRHAPFYGWIRDLSAPDPTSLFNLFGLIPWTPPDFLHLGIWPILMGITMWAQFKLNPPPADPIQAKLFQFMPLVFTFLLANFPAGLVIYWAWNNVLSIAQQWVILRKTTREAAEKS
ncbi:MAG: membrane protein insertase YidC [Rhodospirillaceae bacterium]|nr:MAG: membrane protein insertase YidC [Rhodospirillaceae bacterium]